MEKALKQLISRLRGIDWALIGSTNMKIQGIAVNPKDLDILTQNRDIETIAEIFNSKVTVKNGFKETCIILNDKNIHFVGLEDNPIRNKKSLKEKNFINYRGLNLPCVPLKYELEFYQQSNRLQDLGKVKLINDKLMTK